MFGTDGIRGTPGKFPLDEHTIARVGAAVVRVLGGSNIALLVVRDTRESGHWIEQHLARGVAAEGGKLVSAGVMPTPAAAFLATSHGFHAALAISASHNPFPDNGIKVLTGDGEKASRKFEISIEKIVHDESWIVPSDVKPLLVAHDLTEEYLAHIRSAIVDTVAKPSLKIAVDCANGATSIVVPRLLKQAGFDLVELNVSPNGCNINDHCGSIHPEGLQKVVVAQNCNLGLAFDGDGDRVILVDNNGGLVDGDAVLFICARYLSERGRLSGNAVAASIMSNIGLEIALKNFGIKVYRCQIGDRQIRETMVDKGLVLGGEQSGHIIFSDLLPTGDGVLTALSVIRVMIESGCELAELRRDLKIYPQVLVNVKVSAKPNLSAEPEIADAIQEAKRILSGEGRVLVRYSGTEPLLRIMIESRNLETARKLAKNIASCVTQRLS